MKRLLLPMIKIGTHDGTFHCDEVVACVLLRLLPRYRDAAVVRSRDPAVLAACDLIVDVGAIFDRASHRYDHHQRDFCDTFRSLVPSKPWDVKLSSAGLVYVFFGEEILAEVAAQRKSTVDVGKLYDKIYENFIMEIDAIDNGVPICEGEPRYSISTNLSSRVGHLNPWWNMPSINEEIQFKKAMELVETEFLDKVNFYLDCWWPARQMVKEALDARFDVHKSGAIIKFSQGGCPWKSHFFDIENEMFFNGNGDDIIQHKIVFVLYCDGKNWRVQCIPVSEKRGFENRLSLYEKWRGLRDEELSKVSGIPGCIFVHSSGFIGGNSTYEGALKMAVDTLEFDK